jgi:hypothetical protein
LKVRSRLTAVIAMLTWYLLVPPYAGHQKFAADTPLIKWYEAADFQSLAECQQNRAATIKKYQGNGKQETITSRANVALFEKSQCVSSDDPRRNGN